MKNLNKFKGFTLVEVLIVIIIIGILIAALLPRLQGSQQRARDTARTAGVNQLSQAIGLLLNDAGTIGPSSSQGTAVCVSSFTAITGSVNGVDTDLSAYLASIPKDPQSNHNNGAALSGGAACNGSFIAILDADGAGALVMAELEDSQVANSANALSSTTGVSAFQTLIQTGGTEAFAVVVE